MVRGIKVFKEYFAGHEDKYIIIGGTACDIQIEEAGLVPRATKDIDMILIVEALDKSFVEIFWKFIKTGNYKKNEKEEDGRKYYRFVNPENKEYPFQLELFSRAPDILDIEEGVYLTPIPTDDDLSSLSAILMDDDYYSYTVNHSLELNGIKIADISSLIILKARAFLDWTHREAAGMQSAKKQIRKHKNDVFRLVTLLSPNEKIELTETIHQDLMRFKQIIGDEHPAKSIFHEMRLNIHPEDVWRQFIDIFNLV